MARQTANIMLNADAMELAEQQRKVDEHVVSVFGRKPESIRFQSTSSEVRTVCFVTVRIGLSAIEFMVANGLLFGVPPKTCGSP